MSDLMVHGGSFNMEKGMITILNDSILITDSSIGGLFSEKNYKIKSNEIESLEIVTEETVIKLKEGLSWGILGAVAFDTLGFVAGVLLGGRKTDITFLLELKDNRKILATTDKNTFIQLKALVL